LPEGATRPEMDATLPSSGLSGYAAELAVTIKHGPGETVMPDGFRIQRGSDAMSALREAGWVIPEADAGVGPRIERGEQGGDNLVTTTVAIPFVPLPEEPGRHLMTLPPMPISVARANGQVMTLCTLPLRMTVDDPIANEVDPKVKGNPPPRPQREEWGAAKDATLAGLVIIALAILLAWLIYKWRARPKIEPPKPKVLPWVTAMRELDAIRRSGLLADGRVDEFFDRVDHATRMYLGARYGFDGLESTSEEIRRYLQRVYPPISQPERIHEFLSHSDFMKYAEVTPLHEDCEQAIARAEQIVSTTTPPNAVRVKRDEEDPRRAA
jgi:hypothetical protein